MRSGVFFGLCLAGPLACMAGDWKLTPRVTVSETYSDNVGLSAEGAERDDFITDANAGLSLHGSGRRLTVNADYNFQQVLHLRETNSTGHNQQWQVAADAEIVERVGFVNVRTTRSQQNQTNIGRISSDNLSTANRTDVTTFSVTPRVMHRFGRWAETEFSITYDVVSNDTGPADSTSESIGGRTSIRSGSRFQKMPWSVDINRREQTNTDDSTSKFSTLDARASYVISRRWSVDFGAGYDKNEFVSGTNNEDGLRWRSGVTWTPTPRTQLGAGYEKRFFDDTYFLDFSHRSRRTRFAVTYDESVTTSRELQLERQLVPLRDQFGDPIDDPVTGDPIEVPVNFLVPSDEVVVIRAFSGAVEFTGRRTTATVSVQRSERSFQATGDEETQTSASLRLSRTMSSRLTASGGVSWQMTEPRTGTGAGEETRWGLDASLSYAVSPSASGSISYRYTSQEDDGAVNDFDENRLIASVNMRF